MKNLRGTYEAQMETIGSQEVRRIFDLNASGVSQPKIPDMINSEYPDSNIGDSLVRDILHRKIFSDVEIEPGILDIVTRRFRTGVRRRGKNKASGTPCRDRDTDLLHDVLDARLAYQKVLDKAIEAGMKEESVVAWCDVVARGDLR